MCQNHFATKNHTVLVKIWVQWNNNVAYKALEVEEVTVWSTVLWNDTLCTAVHSADYITSPQSEQ